MSISETKRRRRLAVYERDNYRCVYCGSNAKQVLLTLDHVIPLSLGGSSTMRNLVTCCYPCNTHKGNALLADTSKLPVPGEYASTKKRDLSKHPAYYPPTAEDLWPGIWYRQTNLSKAQAHILKQAISTYNYQFSRKPGNN